MVAPSRQSDERHVIVDADEVDRPRAPRADRDGRATSPAAVGRVMAEIFGPVGAHSRSWSPAPRMPRTSAASVAQRLDEGIGVGAVAQRRQPAQLRADQEGVDAAGRQRQMRIVQDQPAIAPVVRPGIDRPCRRRWRNRPAPRCRRKPPTCVRRRRRLVGASRPGPAPEAGDRPAPGIGRLRRAAVGVGQPVARAAVHHDERIERHLQPARLELADRRASPTASVGVPP